MKASGSDKPLSERRGPKLKGSDKRKMISIRMPPDLIERLKESGESQSDQIERALRNYYKWQL
jgi:uncharacterized protein (DUF4415 family)